MGACKEVCNAGEAHKNAPNLRERALYHCCTIPGASAPERKIGQPPKDLEKTQTMAFNVPEVSLN